MATNVETIYSVERDQLVTQLRDLTGFQWSSLCDGWTVRDVAAHLLMPYELSLPRFFAGIVRARLRFGRLADHWVHADPRTGAHLVESIAATTASGFNVPGAGENAALSHLFLHPQDIRGQLNLVPTATTEAGRRVLDDLVSGRHAIYAATTHGLRLEAPDIDWSSGSRPPVSGPAAVLANALSGRTTSAAELQGEGAETLRTRL